MAEYIGNEEATTVKRSQVYLATHNGEGQSLPYMYRSFISFTFGGRKIEDFNLISTISGDRLDRTGYASFDDTVTTYDNLDGQHYWATHYKTNQMDFTLSTDGIDQKQLDDFLYWFKAGTVRELVLAEHPNRAIMARVAEPPTLNLLPFEHDIVMTISSKQYQAKTTLYKGDIQLSLVMDQPHWYAIQNILGIKTIKDGREYYEDYWQDISLDTPVWIFSSKDALKILYEDGIPLGSMIANSMLLGNNSFANIDTQEERKTWSKLEGASDFFEGIGARIYGVIENSEVITAAPTWTKYQDDAEAELNLEYDWDPTQHVGEEDQRPFTDADIVTRAQLLWQADEDFNKINYLFPNGTYIGRIAGAIVDASGEGIVALAPGNNGYFFYAGTAPSPATITFTLQPSISDYYINVPKNSYSNPSEPYNTFTIESVNKQVLRFTTPNLYSSFNTTISIFDTYVTSSYTWEYVRKQVRDQVRHAAIRAWAIRCVDFCAQGNLEAIASAGYKTDLKNYLSYVLKNNSGVISTATFTFNSRTGEATGLLKYRTFDPYASLPTSSSDWENYGTFLSTAEEEDVGDMLRSNYIIIQERNYPTSNGKIVAWTNTDEGKTHSHRIYHDVYGGLSNIQILYKNMYL